jgi:hypothetical protein
MWEEKEGGSRSEVGLRESMRLLKITKAKKAKMWDVAQVIEHLLSKCEALSSIPIATKKKKKNKHTPWNRT